LVIRDYKFWINNQNPLQRVFVLKISFNNEYFEGKHEPIITKKLFDECQEVMKRKSKP